MARGGVGNETERALFFLGVVQPEDGVEPVEQAAEFDRILGLDGVLVQCLQKPVESGDLVLDLRVGPAHRGRGVGAAQRPVDQWNEQFLVGPLVRQQLTFQSAQQYPDRFQITVVRGQLVRHGADLFDQR